MREVNDDQVPTLTHAVQSEYVRLRIPTRLDWIEKTVDFLERRAVLSGACDPERAGKLIIALHEALTNAVVHGNLEVSADLKQLDGDEFAHALAIRSTDPRYASRTVDITIDYNGQRCEWTLTDQGAGFDYVKLLAPAQRRVASLEDEDDDIDVDIDLPSGRGILLMRAFMDSVEYRMGGRQCVLTMRRGDEASPRKSGSVRFVEPVRVVPLKDDGSVDWDAAYDAISRELSDDGITIVQSRLSEARRIMIELGAGSSRIYLPATVQQVESVGEGMVKIGCQFAPRPGAVLPSASGKLPDQSMPLDRAVGELLARSMAERLAPDERRAHERAVYTERVDVIQPATGSRRKAHARDLSKGGMAFIATFSLPLEEVELILYHGNSEAIHIRAKVVRSQKIIEGLFDIGARFLGWVQSQ